MSKRYPGKELRFICYECALKLGGLMHPDHIATYHMGICDKCREEHVVTEPRDYGLTMDGEKR